MTYASKLLDKVFFDDEADLVLGEVSSKPRVAAKTMSCTARDNFADVLFFFKTHGRLPRNTDEDLSEHAVWCKLQGVLSRPELVAQIRDLDDCGILAHASASDLQINHGNMDTTSVFGVDDRGGAIGSQKLHQIAKMVQSALHASAENLKNIEEWLAALLESQQFDEGAHEQLNQKLLALANKFHDTAHITVDELFYEDTVDGGRSIEDELAQSQATSDERPGPVIEMPDDAQSGADSSCSIDDVFADGDLDDLLGPDNPESAILGGRRAVKVFERSSTEQTTREPCAEFERYKPLFDTYRTALDDGRLAVSLTEGESLIAGDIFLWDGLIAILTGETLEGDVAEHSGARRQVVFSNGTEAWLREGSIKRCMYAYSDRGNKIVCKRLVPVTKDLFSGNAAGSDSVESMNTNTVTGHIYVARTLSNDPTIAKIRKTAVKIGVTKNPVHLRVSNAENDSTFLFAKVDVIQTFTLHNLDPRKVEEMLHAFFAGARLKIRAKDRFGKDVVATEWFLLPPKLITQAVKLLLSNTLQEYKFSARDGKIERKA